MSQTVWVVMRGDSPCAVRSSEDRAEKFIDECRRADRERRQKEGATAPLWRYRILEFTLDGG